MEFVGYYITEKCRGCRLCYSQCPEKCIDMSQRPFVINLEWCSRCGRCMSSCPYQAVRSSGMGTNQ